jgi:MFS family permease
MAVQELAAPGPAGSGGRHRRGVSQPPAAAADHGVVVAVMCLVVGLIFGASTILFTSLPSVAADLGASQTSALWMVDIYPLVIAALLMPCGALIDRHGRKRGALFGLVLTVLFFGAAALADSPGAVIACLGLAGVGGAFAFPATLATITTVIPKDRRGTAVGIWAASMMGGGTVGAATGGAVSAYAGTFWVFASPALFALVLLVLTAKLVPESNDDRQVNLDPVGSLLSIGGVGLFVLGMIEAPSKGWTHPLTLGALVGVTLLIAFVRWELLTPRPLFDVRLLLEPRFGCGSLVNVLSWFFALGTFFNGIQYRTFTLDYGPVRTGISLMSMAILTVVMGAIGPRLARTYGGRPVLVAGLALMAAGSAGIAAAATTHGYWSVAFFEVVAFGGLGLVGGPATEAIVDALPDSHQGVASAVNDTTREMGVAIGVALMGSTFNLAYRSHVADNPNDLPAAALDATRGSPIACLHIAAELPAKAAQSQTDLVREAVANGLSLAMATACAVLAFGAVVVLRAHPKTTPSRTEPEQVRPLPRHAKTVASDGETAIRD